jgi:hypothetical protein
MSFIGIPIGFYGYVFPGNINLMVLELYNLKRYKFLVFMLSLIIIFESIYCVVSLIFLSSIRNNVKFFAIIESTSYTLLLVMGLWMLLERKEQKNKSNQNTVFRGIFNIIIHPQQIPYWLIAGSIMSGAFSFNQNNAGIITFAFFNSIGTLLAMVFYMFFGKKIMNYFNLNMFHINKVMGGVYILIFFYHLL